MTDTNPSDTIYVLEFKTRVTATILPTPTFDEYSEQFKDFLILDRRADGVLLAQAHTRGDSTKLSVKTTGP